MKRTILLIAIIVCASCNMGVRTMQKQFDEGYNQLEKLYDQAQDLQAQAAAAAAAVDPQAVVDTVNGLTEAARFWGSFIGNEVFDAAGLEAKIKILEDKKSKLQEYASTDGTQAMVQLNQAIWSISTSIKSVQALAIQLKKGAYNVQLISAIAFKQGTDELTGSNKAIYQAAIKVLYNTLKAGLLNCKTIKLNLDTLSNQLIGIETTMGSLSTSLTNTAEGKSKEFKNWRDDMRAKVYGGCTVSVLCGPHCIAICYSIGAGVLESEIAKYKRETESFVTEFNQFAASFSAMSTMAGQASLVSKKWYNKVQDFENVIQTQYDLIEGTQDVLYMNQEVRQIISQSLTDLISECDKVIADTTGQLDETTNVHETEEFMATAEPVEEEMLDTSDYVHMVQKMCKKMYGSDEAKIHRCFNRAQKTLLSM